MWLEFAFWADHEGCAVVPRACRALEGKKGITRRSSPQGRLSEGQSRLLAAIRSHQVGLGRAMGIHTGLLVPSGRFSQYQVDVPRY